MYPQEIPTARTEYDSHGDTMSRLTSSHGMSFAAVMATNGAVTAGQLETNEFPKKTLSASERSAYAGIAGASTTLQISSISMLMKKDPTRVFVRSSRSSASPPQMGSSISESETRSTTVKGVEAAGVEARTMTNAAEVELCVLDLDLLELR